MKPSAPSVFAVASVAAVLILAGCGSGDPPVSRPLVSGPTAGPASEAAAAATSVSNCGSTVSVRAVPTRAVANDINSTEEMLALGLQSHMVGDFGVDKEAASAIPAPYRAGFAAVRDVSPKYFTLEPLLGVHPDFLYAGWNYGLTVGSPTLTPTALATHGITTLALTESCAHVQPGTSAVSIENTYTDLTNLGTLFGVSGKAAQVVGAMKAEVAATTAKIAGTKPVTVFLYDSGTDAPFTAPALATPDALISLAGGTNVFGGLRKTWTSVSWEQVVATNPQCILINDYDTPSWQDKEAFLKSFALTKKLAAVQNNCFFHLRYDQLTPSPLNAQAVTAVARWLHPNAFGQPASAPSYTG